MPSPLHYFPLFYIRISLNPSPIFFDIFGQAPPQKLFYIKVTNNCLHTNTLSTFNGEPYWRNLRSPLWPQCGWLEHGPTEKAWCKFITMRLGDGFVIRNGRNTMLTLCAESWVTRRHLQFTTLRRAYKAMSFYGLAIYSVLERKGHWCHVLMVCWRMSAVTWDNTLVWCVLGRKVLVVLSISNPVSNFCCQKYAHHILSKF